MKRSKVENKKDRSTRREERIRVLNYMRKDTNHRKRF